MNNVAVELSGATEVTIPNAAAFEIVADHWLLSKGRYQDSGLAVRCFDLRYLDGPFEFSRPEQTADLEGALL